MRAGATSDAGSTMTDETHEPEGGGEAGLPAGTSLPRHLSPEQLRLLEERVNRRYGAFGVRASIDDAGERRAIADDGWRSTVRLVAGVAAASAFLSFVSTPAWNTPGEWSTSFRLDTAFAVVWAPLLFWVMLKERLHESLRIYVALALFIESFSETMFLAKGEGGYWDSIMWPAAVAYFGTVKELSGLPGASLPIFFFVTAVLLHRAMRRRWAPERPAPPRFARDALLVFLATMIALCAIGIARGGRVDWAFQQTLHMLQLPLVALLFLYALRVPEDLAAVGSAYVVAALARSLLVFWVYFGVCMPQGITDLPGKPEWCTTHSDTVLFVGALVILLAHALEQRHRRVVVRCLAAGAVILAAIVLNNRRLAFVSLGIAPLVMYFALAPSKRKRRVTVALALVVPLLVAYVLYGSEVDSSSPLFKPAKGIVSVLDQRDTSAASRDIENENLIYTLRQSPFFTRGFGHEYEHSPDNPPVDLSYVFQNYRLIAHNGVLWLWSIAGVVGFTLLWFLYPLAGTLAVRGHRAAETPLERTSALAALGCIAVCVVQIWGDQGLQSYTTLVTFALAFAVSARLAETTTTGR